MGPGHQKTNHVEDWDFDPVCPLDKGAGLELEVNHAAHDSVSHVCGMKRQ